MVVSIEQVGAPMTAVETLHGPRGVAVVLRQIAQASPGRVTYRVVGGGSEQCGFLTREAARFYAARVVQEADLQWPGSGIDRSCERKCSAGVGVLPSDWMALRRAAQVTLEALRLDRGLSYTELRDLRDQLGAALAATYEVDHTLDVFLDGGAR